MLFYQNMKRKNKDNFEILCRYRIHTLNRFMFNRSESCLIQANPRRLSRTFSRRTFADARTSLLEAATCDMSDRRRLYRIDIHIDISFYRSRLSTVQLL
jgi:hypothetical protein